MRQPFVIAHTSDLHLDGKGGRLSATGPLLSALTTRMKEFSDVPAKILLVTGDLVETPDKQSMQEADQFLKTVSEKAIFTDVVIIAGNHDVKAKGLIGWKDDFYDRFKAPRTTDTIRRGGLELVLLDSNRGLLAKGHVPATSYDEMVENAADISEILRNEIRTGPDDRDGPTIRVLALHHHPLPLPEGEGKKVYGIPDEPFMYMVSSATFLDAAMSLDVSLILHGHRHVTGLTRYSVPSRTFEAGRSENFWRTVYVLSCPSSTGADCDAGFNIITLDGYDRFERAGYQLSISRYTRPRNAGAFEPLDRAAHGRLQFPVGEETYRDIALQIQDEVLRAKDLDRHQIAEYARRSLVRKAFLSREEHAWPYAFYAYVVTYKLWGRPLQHLFVQLALKIDQNAAFAIIEQLTGLVDLAARVLGVSGSELDDFRSRAQTNQRDFVRALPAGPAAGVNMDAIQLTRRKYLKTMDDAAAVLCGARLGLGTYGEELTG
ncbi:phosphohydrolase [Mesorhizobium sp. LNHC252B00]|uniref:metallophosphoesterase family protein n=1 Tax=Mesorhizobium sp. LNHC252B00 TaxID=1287252 RepID=UPI0003CE63E7|nr:metallophosphoesterase [Mesorhizobium sp. LNHC252B00]ESY64004.1 phosphohydrolase [Mesorhizobium sp. LNHC252B00]